MGKWIDLNGIRHIDIRAAEEDSVYIAHVRMDTFSMEEEKPGCTLWAYSCVFDGESRVLRSVSRVTGTGYITPDAEMQITDSDFDFTEATFSFDEEGRLIWSDEAEGLDDSMVFVPYTADAEADEAADEDAILFAAIDEALAGGSTEQ